MHKITFHFYRSEFATLVGMIPDPGQYSRWDILNGKSLEEIALLEWRSRITPQQLLTWHLRDRSKQYAVSMPVSVALALWLRCRQMELTIDVQMLSDKIDYTLVEHGFSPKFLPFTSHA